jgi:hypothetical protein
MTSHLSTRIAALGLAAIFTLGAAAGASNGGLWNSATPTPVPKMRTASLEWSGTTLGQGALLVEHDAQRDGRTPEELVRTPLL